MRITLFLIVCAVFLGCTLSGFAQEKKASGFWKNVEVGTNLIPMVDSLTLQPSNLQLKYYYGKYHDNAFRVNLFVNNVAFTSVYNARYHIQLGHIWYYSFKPKISLYFATDLEYFNYSSCVYNLGGIKDDDRIYHVNDFHAYFSGGIKYQFYKNLSLELETALKISSVNTFANHQLISNGPGGINDSSILLNYNPINCLTLNYRF